MMAKRRTILLFFSLLSISACQSSSELNAKTDTPQTIELANSLAEISTALATPTKTPRPTRTATPTPTYSPTLTPYPTLNAASLVTYTPAPPAECPPNDPDVEITLDLNREQIWEISNEALQEMIWEALNIDGALLEQVAVAYLDALESEREPPLMDLTGDGVEELYIRFGLDLYVYGCDSGKHKVLLIDSGRLGTIGAPSIEYVGDMNMNGVPEIVTEFPATTAHNSVINIYEWNGTEFISIIKTTHGENAINTSRLAYGLFWYDSYFGKYPLPTMEGPAKLEVRDLDGNGTKELVLVDIKSTSYWWSYETGPYRGKKVIFEWDGIHFLFVALEMGPPDFRFQAVQDADRLFFMGNFEEALVIYQDVLYKDDLDWWSEMKMSNLMDQYFARRAGDPTPTPLPPNDDEFANLTAYTRYRILLHHIARAWVPEARTVNITLQAMFPPGAVGHEYAEMATLLWNSYQLTGSLEQACAGVIAYAESHPEILAPLGDKEHGLQSHIYVPADVCPFPWPPKG